MTYGSKCYADNSANTTLQCKSGTENHFPIKYLHIIQLTAELDTVITKCVAQYPLSLCCVITPKGVPPRTCKPIPCR